jgi:hypothetical protein
LGRLGPNGLLHMDLGWRVVGCQSVWRMGWAIHVRSQADFK